MEATYSGDDKRLQYLFQNASSVSVTQTLASGTKVGEVTVDGTTTELFAPSGGGGGTTVIANPVGTPTADLDTVQIGNIIYDIPGSGGSGNITYGIENPSGGSDGDVYLKLLPGYMLNSIKYVKFQVTARRGGGDTTTQFARFKFLDANDNELTYPAGTTATSDVSAASPSEGADNLLTDSGKLCTFSLPTVTFTFPNGNLLDVTTYTKYRWYTANDANDRDPVSWVLSFSVDGTYWFTADEVQLAEITTTRETIGYTGTLPTSLYRTAISDIYVNKSRTWVSDNFASDDRVVTDVTYNGESVVDNGVAEIPIIPGSYNKATPNMTSDTTPSGVVSASSYYNSDYAPWYAFCGTLGYDQQTWACAANQWQGAWIQYQFPTAKVITKLTTVNRNEANPRCVKTFYFQGSNDGTNYDNLMRCELPNQGAWYTKDFYIPNDTAYLYYRLFVTETWDTFTVGFAQIYMYEPLEVVANPSGSATDNLKTLEVGGTIYNVVPDYSTTEHKYGRKWIDGNDLYEITVPTNDPVPAGGTLIQRIVQTGYDTLLYTK